MYTRMHMNVHEHFRNPTYPHAHTRIHSLSHTRMAAKPFPRGRTNSLSILRFIEHGLNGFHHFPWDLPFLSHSVTAMAKDLGSLPRLTFLRNAQKHS